MENPFERSATLNIERNHMKTIYLDPTMNKTSFFLTKNRAMIFVIINFCSLGFYELIIASLYVCRMKIFQELIKIFFLFPLLSFLLFSEYMVTTLVKW